MFTNKLFEEANKIVPFRKLLPMYVVLGIIGFVIILGVILDSELPNNDFYRSELNGKIIEIHREPKDTYFLIGDNWYLIKNECIDYMDIGDSLLKQENSYNLVVFDIGSKKIKFQHEVKRLIFKKVSAPSK